MAPKNKDLSEYTEEDMEPLDWINLGKDMDRAFPVETQAQKFMRKFKENPFVPVGASATVAALVYGLWNLRTGNQKMSQYMMRTRIVAQGFTVVAIVVGIGISAKKAVESNQ